MMSNNKVYLLVISIISTIGGFLFGYDTAVISGCNTFLQSHFDLSSAMLGWVVSSALLGTIVGCVVSGIITDRIGRKRTLLIAAFLLSLSAVGCMLVPNFHHKVIGFWFTMDKQYAFQWLVSFRMIGGIGVGITSVVAPIYISELTPADRRGRMVSFYQLSITLGILVAFLVDWIILNTAGLSAGVLTYGNPSFFHWIFVEEIWRGMFGTEIPIAIAFFILLFFTPESPRWLATKQRSEEASLIMTRIMGEELAQKEMSEIAKRPTSKTKGVKELFSAEMRTPLAIGILLPMFSHLSGIAAIMYFAPNILNESMNSVEGSFFGAVLVGIVNSLFTIVAISKIELFGRKRLLMIGVIGAFVSLASVGLLFAIDSPYVIVPLLFYVASFAFSYGPIVWVIISEIFPTNIRGLAVSMGSFSLMATGFVITLSNPVLFKSISPSGTFFLYALLTLPAIGFIWKFVPETKGKSLEEIEAFWKEKKN